VAGAGNSIVFIGKINEDYEAHAVYRDDSFHRRRPMRHVFQFRCVLAAVLCLSGGFAPPCPAQTEFPPCAKDGSPPAGESQCECPEGWQVYRGEYNKPEKEYRVRLPDGVAATTPKAPCKNHGFRVYLTHPNAGDLGRSGDFGSNQLWVLGAEQHRRTFEELADGFAQSQREDAERIHATDLLIDQPVQTSLSSLTAIHLKASRTEVDHGEMIYEAIIANNPRKEIVYVIEMVSPASRYEKNHELFKAVVEGFSYTPALDVQK
jgi:hypothetical protein